MALGPREVHFRRMVSNIFRRLGAEDVQQIAYVRLKGKEDTKKYSAAKPQATSMDLLESLEQYNYISQDNIQGLKEVLRDANRADLVKQVDVEMRKLCKKKRNGVKKGESAQEMLASSTEDMAGRLGAGSRRERDDEQGRVSVAERVPPLHSYSPPPVPARHDAPRTVAKPGGGKKVPLMPPKKATQETVPLSNRPEGQQLVMQPSIPALSRNCVTAAPPSKPPPPPPPPKMVSRDVEKKEGGERDSGMWTGGESAYDSVSEWTKHLNIQPLPEVGGAQYQGLGATDPNYEHQYATIERTQEQV